MNTQKMPINGKCSWSERLSTNSCLLFLTPNQWRFSFILGLIFSTLLWPLYHHISLWIGVAVFLIGVIIVHLRFASRFIVPFPHIALLIVAIQYVVAAWISFKYPAADSIFNIGFRLPVYLEYATLVLAASTIAWSVGLVKIIPADREAERASPDLLRALDILILIGVASILMGRFLGNTSVGFVLVVLGNLRYFAGFGRMLYRGQGWKWRLCVIFAAEFIIAADGGMWGNIIVWGLWTVAFWVYLLKPSIWKIVLIFTCGLLLMPSLHESKWEMRMEYWTKDASNSGFFESSRKMLGYLGTNLNKTLDGGEDNEFIGETVVRINQGWIIDRVMQHVPKNQPYARGSTLKEALIATLLPRFIMPDKQVAGGRENVKKYAGLELREGASMNLGYAGEMYANFGFWGGVIGSGGYVLLFALLFRWVAVRALSSPLWWCIMPYVAFPVLKAEEGIMEVVNWTFKSCIIMAAVYYGFPAIRRALSQNVKVR